MQCGHKPMARGVTVVQNRCPKIEYQRLFGECCVQGGFNTGVISSKQVMACAAVSAPPKGAPPAIPTTGRASGLCVGAAGFLRANPLKRLVGGRVRPSHRR